MVLWCIKTHSTGLKEHSGMWIAALPWCESTESIKIQFLNFRAIEPLKVNPGTQIRVSPSLSRDTEHTHSLIDPPALIGVNTFLDFFWNFKNFKEWNFEIVKIFYSFLRIEWYVEIRYLITSFQSYKLMSPSLLVHGRVAHTPFPTNYGQSAWNSVKVQPISTDRTPNHARKAAEKPNRRNYLHYFRTACTAALNWPGKRCSYPVYCQKPGKHWQPLSVQTILREIK